MVFEFESDDYALTTVCKGEGCGESSHASCEVIFHICISCSAEFVWCMSGGVYWSLVFFLYSSTSHNVSLSILCSNGLYSLLLKYK